MVRLRVGHGGDSLRGNLVNLGAREEMMTWELAFTRRSMFRIRRMIPRGDRAASGSSRMYRPFPPKRFSTRARKLSPWDCRCRDTPP